MNVLAPTAVRLDSGKPIKGVLGWLLVFCISLTIVVPIVQGRIALIAISGLAHAHVITLISAVRLMTVGFIYFGLSIFSLCAGVSLWREDSRGPALAKVYLCFSAVIVILLYGIFAAGGLQVQLPRIAFRRLVYSITWFCYLTFSKRVRETYSHPD